MGFCVLGGAVLRCSFGLAPSVLNVLPENKVMSTMAVGTIMDNKPLVNILPFAMCNSMMNPMVAAATAAAFGVLTPMPCLPVIPAPWAPGSTKVMIANKPALTKDCTLNCAYGGAITIEFPGTVNIQTS